ncbi:hypothetical protein AAHC03_0859 [Spirometra sp. Aus1]
MSNDTSEPPSMGWKAKGRISRTDAKGSEVEYHNVEPSHGNSEMRTFASRSSLQQNQAVKYLRLATMFATVLLLNVGVALVDPALLSPMPSEEG